MGNVLWKEVRESLESEGYSLERRLSSSQESNASVWLASYVPRLTGEQISGEKEKRVLKISSSLFEMNLLDDGARAPVGQSKANSSQEIESLRKINHPRIPKLLDTHRLSLFESDNSLQVLALEYIDADNLQKPIDKGTPITDEKQLRTILKDTLSALACVHESLDVPVLHRDIKPSNILFNGTNAWLIDFDFSRSGLRSLSYTVIDTLGYAPQDALSGLLTPSQDLCALGNVVIAAAYGKPIAHIRAERGREAFSQVDTNDLRISPNLKRFLRKMTLPNPAYRYQSASQAKEDIDRLDEISPVELEEKVSQITRSKPLTMALGKLKDLDALFDYNVPAQILSTCDDDALLEHLRRAYAKDRITIDKPEEIVKYAKSGDRVVKRGADAFYPVKLKSNTEWGRIKNVKPGDNAEVTFPQIGEVFLSAEELIIYAKDTWAGPYQACSNVVLNKFKAWSTGDTHKLREYYVRYTGQDIIDEQSTARIPNKSEGVICGIRSGEKGELPSFRIMWENRPDLHYVTQNDSTGNIRFPCTYEAFSIGLIKYNSVKFDEIYSACEKEAREQTPSADSGLKVTQPSNV